MIARLHNSNFVARLHRLTDSWLGRISGALADQAIFSGGNFLVNILLARWLGPEGYGAYAVAFAWLMLAQNLYEALLIEPLAIYGSGKYAKQFRAYMGQMFYAHIILTLIVAALMGLGAWYTLHNDSRLVFLAMTGAALAAPFYFTRWLTRQPFYVLSRPHWSVVGGTVFVVINVVALVVLLHTGWLNPLTALLTMGLGALCGSLLLAVLRLKPDMRLRQPDIDRREVLRDHVEYGKWAAPARILNWIPGNVYFIILPVVLSLEANATLRAIGNLIYPLYLMINAISGVLLPSLVRTYERDGLAALHRRLRGVAVPAVGAVAVFALVITVFGQQIVSLLYVGQYDEFTTFPIVATMAVFPVIAVMQTLLDIALRAIGQVRLTLFSTLIWGAGTLTIGVAMMIAYGLLGTNLGQMITAGIALLVTFYFYRRHVIQRIEPTD